MEEYRPNAWILLKCDSKVRPSYRILAGWDEEEDIESHWRLNTHVLRVTEYDDYYRALSRSGSVYCLPKISEHTNKLTGQVYLNLLDQPDVKITLVSMKDVINEINDAPVV